MKKLIIRSTIFTAIFLAISCLVAFEPPTTFEFIALAIIFFVFGILLGKVINLAFGI